MNTTTLIDVIVLVLAYVGLSVACLLIRWLIDLPYHRGEPVQENRKNVARLVKKFRAPSRYGVTPRSLLNLE